MLKLKSVFHAYRYQQKQVTLIYKIYLLNIRKKNDKIHDDNFSKPRKMIPARIIDNGNNNGCHFYYNRYARFCSNNSIISARELCRGARLYYAYQKI